MIGKITLASVLCVSGAIGWSQSDPGLVCLDEGGHADPRDIIGKARISLAEAIGKASAVRPGAVVQAELEGETEDGKTVVFFEVMVLGKDGNLYELKLDPASGEIQSNEEAGDDEEEELAEFRAVLRHCELGVLQLIAKAGEVVNGHAVKAGLELEHGQPLCEITIVNGRYLIEAKLEARAGHLVELELASGAGESCEEHGEEGDDEEADRDDEGEEEEEAEGHGEEEKEEGEESGRARRRDEERGEGPRAERRREAREEPGR
ncbi:MAG: PepSY domain-containing protein [Planctomycetes bacterium]|nr:PepSY domain-containing protein [Planctomycetota bacterium]